MKNEKQELAIPTSFDEAAVKARWAGNTETPLVSVLIHTYNHENYIEYALVGALTQSTGFPFEIIVHDDASTDNTLNIINRYKLLFPNIINVISQTENQRQIHKITAKNFTFPVARGDYVAMCEGDDYWIDTQKLARQVKLMQHNPSINICIHPARMLLMQTQQEQILGLHGNKQSIKPVREPAGHIGQYSPTASYLMRRRTLMDRMPDWWYEITAMGDYFMETILGIEGLLYTPQVMSVHRSGAPGSYTMIYERLDLLELEEEYARRCHSILRLLDDFPEIPRARVIRRMNGVRNTYVEYAKIKIRNAYECMGHATDQ